MITRPVFAATDAIESQQDVEVKDATADEDWCKKHKGSRESSVRKVWQVGSIQYLMFMAPSIFVWSSPECVGTKLVTPRMKVVGNHNSKNGYPKRKPYNRHDAKAEAEALLADSDWHDGEGTHSQKWTERRRVACKKVRIRPKHSCKEFRDMGDRIEVVYIRRNGNEVILETIWKKFHKTVYR